MTTTTKNIMVKISAGLITTALTAAGIAVPMDSDRNTTDVFIIANKDEETDDEFDIAEKADTETVFSQIAMSGAESEYMAQMSAAPKQNASAAAAQSANDTENAVTAHYWCSCGYHTTDKHELMKHTVEGNRKGDMIHSYNTTYGPADEGKDIDEKWAAKEQAEKDTAEKAAKEQDSDTTMVRVCQCKEHFVMEGDWKTEWRKHVIQVHHGSCHWGDNAFTEAEMRRYWPEDFENKTVEDMSEKEAAEKAEKERLEKEAAEKAAREQAEREAAEKAAKEQAEREAAEKAEKERAEREAAERAAKEQAEREAAEKAEKEQAEREAAEKAAKEQAEREAAEKAAKEQAEREAAKKAAEEASYADAETGEGVTIR